ncbi:uncharacterized protein LOC129725805 isoform X2 [Wyeomyia smithii]|uniref:uncharacterized protein LOC129725805 isoform X2 n=1 Tax=Wyeomyia smithii TaxID=174621 RepID=UPI002467C6C2|nr:uncharacterized protein LOC129725805 isoform X2 [Wyeomyia smithii]
MGKFITILSLIIITIIVRVSSLKEVTAVPCDSVFGCIAQVKCAPDQFWAPAASLDGCCPGCVKGLGLQQPGCDDSNPCAPGLLCSAGGICQLDTSTCLATNHIPPKIRWKPTCDSAGNYLPKQCRGDRMLGRCFCYSSSGNRIFGGDWRGKADDMTCACSRRRADLEAGGRNDVTLHCSANGNFEQLQCDGGACWCADAKTGEPWPQAPIVLPAMWKNLPCYNNSLHGDQYLRQCESEAFAQKLMDEKFAIHGHINATHTYTVCDYDGTYGKYEIERGIAYCTWRNGERTTPFQASSLKLNTMDCNCARDQKIFAAAGIDMVLLCEENGSYAPLQDRNGELFCVDQHGFEVASQVTPETDCGEYMFM